MSCGATQETSGNSKCNFCGNIINIENANDLSGESIYSDGEYSIITYKKALEYKYPSDTIKILYSNIDTITTTLNLKPKKLMSNNWIVFLYIVAILGLAFNTYINLIPHKELVTSVEYSRETGLDGIEMDSQISIGWFIFSLFLYTIFPLLAVKGVKDENRKREKSDENIRNNYFICFQIRGVGLKTININTANETQRVYEILNDRIERFKMSKE